MKKAKKNFGKNEPEVLNRFTLKTASSRRGFFRDEFSCFRLAPWIRPAAVEDVFNFSSQQSCLVGQSAEAEGTAQAFFFLAFSLIITTNDLRKLRLKSETFLFPAATKESRRSLKQSAEAESQSQSFSKVLITSQGTGHLDRRDHVKIPGSLGTLQPNNIYL